MSDDTREATTEEKRVIIVHDCALEILSLPAEERSEAISALASLVLPRVPEVVSTPTDPQMSMLTTLVSSFSSEQKLNLVRMLSPEQRALFSRIFQVDLPDLPEPH